MHGPDDVSLAPFGMVSKEKKAKGITCLAAFKTTKITISFGIVASFKHN